MKKLISLVLAVILLFAFVSCDENATESSEDVSVYSSEEIAVSEETTEKSDVSAESSEEELSENTMFVVEDPTEAVISAGHRNNVRISYSKNKGVYSVYAKYSGGRIIYTSISTKMGVADDLGGFVFSPQYKNVVDSPKELAFYGLDSDENAAAVIKVSGNNSFRRNIRIGNMYIGGKRVDGGGDVFNATYFPISVINEKDFAYVNDTVYGFINNHLFRGDLKDVTSMTLETEGKSFFIDRDVDGNWRINGNEDGMGYTSELFDGGIIGVGIVDKYTDTLPKKYDVRVSINHEDKTTVLEFKYNDEGKTGICRVNGDKAYSISYYGYTLCDMLDLIMKNERIPE